MKVLITGGTGFLGRGLLRRFSKEWDITVLSRDEYKQDLCRQRWPNVKYRLGDVTDPLCMMQVVKGHDLVIHTAAIKYIPEAEDNVEECIRINVHGTENTLTACEHHDVRIVCLSTDKATSPLNTYGITKALCERLVGSYARRGVQCTAVRYGNVIGSTGSVITVFNRQLRDSGYVTVTDPNMTRFWISVDQAIDLILEAADNTQCGDVVIPKPASMRMGDLANILVKTWLIEVCHVTDEWINNLSDKKVDEKIKVVGIRPGEKLHESLLDPAESVRAQDMALYYHFKPAWHEPVHNNPFVLSSNCPPVMIQDKWMLEQIRDAATV